MMLQVGLFVALSTLSSVGLLYLGLRVIPRAARNLPKTRWGGILFFVADAAINVDRIFTVLTLKASRNHIASWHSIALHAALTLGIYLLVTGLYLEYVQWGPWNRPSTWETEDLKAEIARRWPGPDRRVSRDPNYQGPERRSEHSS